MARNRLSLLEIVQEVLSKMNHDNVNSITQTPESRQISQEAKTLYYDLMDREDWPHLLVLRNLDALGDTDRPNFMQIPENCTRVENIRYEITTSTDTSRKFADIHYLAPHEFMELMFTRKTEDTNVVTITSNSVDFFVINDHYPQYWTTFDDELIVFDSYDADEDETLQASKSIVLAKEIPTWTSTDTFIPDMPDQMFSVYIAELTAAAFAYWKQGASVKDEQRAARGISRLRKDARKINGPDTRADYGRRRSSHYVRSESGDKGSIRQSLSY